MISHDEILDLVSVDDIVIGQEKRSVIYAKNLSNFRVVNGFVCNAEKKLWIPRRHQQKKLFPLHLDASVGGHVMAGETYQEAFARETSEELNINIEKYPYKKIVRLTPHEHGTSAFMWVYLIESNLAPAYNQNDFVDFYWFSVEELLQKLFAGEKSKGDLLPMIQAIRDKI